MGGFLFYIENGILGVLIRIALHVIVSKKMEKLSLFCLLTWRYDKHSLAQISPVSNMFSW